MCALLPFGSQNANLLVVLFVPKSHGLQLCKSIVTTLLIQKISCDYQVYPYIFYFSNNHIYPFRCKICIHICAIHSWYSPTQFYYFKPIWMSIASNVAWCIPFLTSKMCGSTNTEFKDLMKGTYEFFNTLKWNVNNI